jgi:hypothetical protein
MGAPDETRDFITLVGGAAGGAVGCRVSNASVCDWIGVLMSALRMIRRTGSHCAFRKASKNWVGLRVKRTNRHPLPEAMPTSIADSRRNWSRFHRTLVLATASPTGGAEYNPHRADVRTRHRPGWRRLRRYLAKPGGNATGFVLFDYMRARNG